MMSRKRGQWRTSPRFVSLPAMDDPPVPFPGSGATLLKAVGNRDGDLPPWAATVGRERPCVVDLPP